MEHEIYQTNSVSQKTPLWKQKEKQFKWSVMQFLQSFCVSNKENKKSCHVNRLYPILGAWSCLPQSWHQSEMTFENQIWRHAWLKTYLSCHIISLILYSSSFVSKFKRTLKHRCTTLSTSSLIQRFLLPARTGSTHYHKTLSNKTGSDRTSYYINDLMHSVLTERLTLNQAKDSDTQVHTLRYFIAEVCRVLEHWWGVYSNLKLGPGLSCPII